MKNLQIILVFTFLLSQNILSQSGWSWQNPYPQGNALRSISFLGAAAYKGWAVGPLGTAIHTTNGGINWEIVDLGTIETLNCVYMHSDNQIFIVGDNGVIFSLYDDGGTIINVEDDISSFPSKHFLSQNFPNPFNPSTKIKYTIPVTLSEVEGSLVSIKVYDILGNEIATLVNEEQSPGTYEVEFSAKGGSASGGNGYSLSSGIYFYQLKAGSYNQKKK